MTPDEIIRHVRQAGFRADDEALQPLRYQPRLSLVRRLFPGLLSSVAGEATDSEETADLRFRTTRGLLATFAPDDHAFATFLFDEETKNHHGGDQGLTDTLRLLGLMLYRCGRLDDLPRLWRAKTANFDTQCGFDVQFVVGAGVEATIAEYRRLGTEFFDDAANYITGCRVSGDFDAMDEWLRCQQDDWKED
jgi:hypothetical protein